MTTPAVLGLEPPAVGVAELCPGEIELFELPQRLAERADPNAATRAK